MHQENPRTLLWGQPQRPLNPQLVNNGGPDSYHQLATSFPQSTSYLNPANETGSHLQTAPSHGQQPPPDIEAFQPQRQQQLRPQDGQQLGFRPQSNYLQGSQLQSLQGLQDGQQHGFQPEGDQMQGNQWQVDQRQGYRQPARARTTNYVLSGVSSKARDALGLWISGKKPTSNAGQGFDAVQSHRTPGTAPPDYDAEAGGGTIPQPPNHDPKDTKAPFPLPNPIQRALRMPDEGDKKSLDYLHSCQDRRLDTQAKKAVLLDFDMEGPPPDARQVAPTPQRRAAMRAKHMPKEELGIYKDKGTELGKGSLLKMEQRLAKAATIDRRALAELVNANNTGGLPGPPMRAAFQAQQQQQQQEQQQQQQQQLQLGALPPLTEEPDAQTTPNPSDHFALPGATLSTGLHYNEHGQLLPPLPVLPQQQQQQQPQYDLHSNILQQQQQQQQQPQYDEHGKIVLLPPPLPQASTGRIDVGQPSLPTASLQGQGAQGQVFPQQPQLQVGGLGTRSPWFDEDGLIACLPNPSLPRKERPFRRLARNFEETRTYARWPVADDTAADEGGRMYRLDVEIERLEFLVHPAMAPEDMVAAKLLSAFREFKRREAVGLAAYYANKLVALEDALLASREHLFALSELAAGAKQGSSASSVAEHEVATLGANLKEAVAHTAGLEREVAETRQLKEEEEMHMLDAVHSMQAMYDQMLELRVSQGYWLTGLELHVEQQPPEESQWSMGMGVARDRLDAELLVVEGEAIAGLPPPPYLFPLPKSMQDLPESGFVPRRLETMCASHAQLVADLNSRLEGLKARPSSDPNDPVVLQLEDQLQALGPAPRRLAPVTPAQRAEALTHAAQRVSVGDVGVPRNPRFVPNLTIRPPSSDPNTAAAQQEQQQRMLKQHGLAGITYLDSATVIVLDEQVGKSPVDLMMARCKAAQGPVRPAIMGTRSNTRYVAKLHVNGHNVDRTRGVLLEDGFTASFNEVFSVQLLRWPESITVHLCEQGAIRDTLISVIPVAVPGMMGTPHIDPCPKQYQFTSQVPHHLKTKGTQLPVTRLPSSGPQSQPQVIYPTGVLHVQCGWVSENAPAGRHMTDEAAHRADGVVTYNNPLAQEGMAADVEAPAEVMPPVPKLAMDRMLRRAANRIGGKANRQQVLKWLSQHAFDPNDPHNAPLVELMKAHEARDGGGVGDEFNLDVLPDVAIEGHRQQAKRAAFLARRWASGTFRDPEKSVLKGARRIRIPTVLSAAETEEMEHMYSEALSLVELAPGGSGPAVAKAMNARQDRAMMMQVGPSLTKGIEEREARIKEFGLRIRSAADRIAGGKQAARKYKTEDVVNDTPLPEFKVDVSTLFSLFMPRRPLKRERKAVKSLVTSVPAETQLVVTIQRGANMPVRAPAVQGGWQSGNDLSVPDQLAGVSVPQLSPAHCFVEVRFRGLSRRTVVSSSQWPYWNEQVFIPVFDTEQEPSTTALLESRDEVTINVFDEVIVDRMGPPRIPRINNEDAISQPLKYPERERRFLGSTHVPLSAIYQMQVMEGTLRLEVPPVLLGYTLLSERPPCVTLCLTLRPRLAPPPAVPEALLSGEVDEITRHAHTWISDLIALPQCRTRVVRALAMEPDGASLLVTRFVAPTPLPPHLQHLASTISIPPFPTVSPTEAVMLKVPPFSAVSPTEVVMLKLARFVALVPYLEDSAMQKRRADVWTTSAQVMAMAAGDAEEHAHLLVGFFLEIGQQAFVVVGASLNGAKSYFVLTTGAPAYDPSNPQVKPHFDWTDVQLRIWNPLTGSVASIKDPTAEMREVGMIYDNSNMWANIQQEAQPWNMSWNLRSPLHWRPFFGTQLPLRELGTVQTAPIYEEREDLLYEQMETRVEEIVRDSLTRARSLGAFVTKPDNKVSRVLKQLLAEVPAAMEGISAASLAASLALAQAQAQGQLPGGIEAGGSRLGERHQAISALQARHNAFVAHESRSEWVNGHILAIPFSDRYAEALTEAVLNTGIHRIADERVKYSLAALVERGGAAFCCCLWVYVAVTR